MWVRVTLHGWLKTGVDSPDGVVEFTVPEATDIAEVVEALRETSPLLDPRACLAMVDGEKVPLSRTLEDGEEVHLYPLFSGG